MCHVQQMRAAYNQNDNGGYCVAGVHTRAHTYMGKNPIADIKTYLKAMFSSLISVIILHFAHIRNYSKKYRKQRCFIGSLTRYCLDGPVCLNKDQSVIYEGSVPLRGGS